MPNMVTPAGEEIFVSPSQVDSALDAGYQWAPDETVTVHTHEGSTLELPADQYNPLEHTLEDPSAQTERLHETTQERIYTSGAQPIAAGIEGFARGATLGLSDVGLRAAGVEKDAERRRQHNPNVALVTEIGGAVAPSLIGAPGVIAPAGALTKGAGLAGKALGRGRTTEGLIAGGIEGLGFSAGQVVSDVALSDDPLTADQAFAHLTTGTLLGAGVGGAFGARRAALERRAQKSLEKAQPMMAEAGEEATGYRRALEGNLRKVDEELLDLHGDALQGARVRDAGPEVRFGGGLPDVSDLSRTDAAIKLEARRRVRARMAEGEFPKGGTEGPGLDPVGASAKTGAQVPAAKAAVGDLPAKIDLANIGQVGDDIIARRFGGDRVWSLAKKIDDHIADGIPVSEGFAQKFEDFKNIQAMIDDHFGFEIVKKSRKARKLHVAGETAYKPSGGKRKTFRDDIRLKGAVEKVRAQPDVAEALFNKYEDAARELLDEIDSAGLRNKEILQDLAQHPGIEPGIAPHKLADVERALVRLGKQADEGFGELAKRRGNFGIKGSGEAAGAASAARNELDDIIEAQLPGKDQMYKRAFEQRRIARMAARIEEQQFVRGPYGGLEPGVDFQARAFLAHRAGGPQLAIPVGQQQANLRAIGVIGKGSADEVGAAFVNLREARKALLKVAGKGNKKGSIQLDLDKVLRQGPENAVAFAQALDNYGLALGQVDSAAGSALAKQFDNIHNQIRAGLSPEAQAALAKIDALDSVELASFLGVKPSVIPEHLGPLGRDALGMYGLARTGNQARAKATTGAMREMVQKARDRARKVKPGDVAGSLLNRALFRGVVNPFGRVFGLLASVGDTALAIERGAAKFVTKPLGRRIAIAGATGYLAKHSFGQPTNERTVVRQRMKEIEEALSNPGATRDRLDAALAPIRATNLQLGYRLADKAMDRLQFLGERMPKVPPENPLVESHWEPTPHDISRWAKYVRAAEEPLSILDDLQTGRVSVEAVETLETLYPELFAEIQGQILDKVMESKKPLPYQKRLALSVLFKVNVEPTAAPEFVHALQQMHQMKAEQGQGAGLPQSGGQLNADGISPATKSQHLEGR